MNLINRTSLLAVALLLPAAWSQADSTAHKTAEKLQQACQADVKKLCADVNPGEGRVLSCINSKMDQVSPDCKKELSAADAKVSKKMDKANVAFRKDCGGDVTKFCSDVPQGKGRILDCLNTHSDDLSQSCKNFASKVRAQAGEKSLG